MELNKLTSIKSKTKRRIGRGDGSGRGTYSGRGMKGQSSRAGGKRRPGFEGGQTPLIRRMPKLRGFKAINKIVYQAVNVAELEEAFKAGDKVTKEALYEAKLILNVKKPVKLLGNGELKKALEITVEKASKSAVEKVEKAKGKVNLLSGSKAAAKKEEVKEEAKEEEK